jgi:proton-translocating NADH-quinone oxidoreductase chain L
MYILVLLLPLISFLTLMCFGRFLGKKGSIFVTIACMFVTLIFSVFIFCEVGLMGYVCTLKIANWLSSGVLNIKFGLLFDSLTATMLLVVVLISFLVHIYSISYMENDPYIIRFISFLSLFTFFMLVLITADNYVQLFLGWEGVGLCSYLLVNFWFTREQANKSAMKAIIVNRVGDFFLFLGLLCIFFVFRTFDFAIINSIALEFEFLSIKFFGMDVRCLDMIAFFLFGAAVGKSAQVGLHTWLPDAMEGPTPVSALIHAATMVTAGIFLVLRSSFLFEFSQDVLNLITFFGTVTAVLASTSGIFQYDIKKVIAYSTSSQLGYMFLACGTSNYTIAIFHLFNHAFFKALLFLGAGSVIHGLNDEQDMRKMGGLYNVMPLTFISMLIGTVALIGLPFLTGFYSKDIIIETLLYKYNLNFFFGCFLACIVTFFTSFYSFRLLILVFMLDYRGAKGLFFKVHDCSYLMAFPLILLSVLTIFVGFCTKDLFIGIASNFWQQAFIFHNDFSESSEFIKITFKLIPFYGTMMGIFLSMLVYQGLFFYKRGLFFLSSIGCNYTLKNIYFFFGKKWFFDFFYNKYIAKFSLYLGYDFVFKTIDRGIIEFFGPLGLVRNFFFLSNQISKIQTGYIYHYFIVKFVGLCLFIVVYNVDVFFIFDLNLVFIILFFVLIAYLINLLL